MWGLNREWESKKKVSQVEVATGRTKPSPAKPAVIVFRRNNSHMAAGDILGKERNFVCFDCFDFGFDFE
jgi:hypothetical protein